MAKATPSLENLVRASKIRLRLIENWKLSIAGRRCASGVFRPQAGLWYYLARARKFFQFLTGHFIKFIFHKTLKPFFDRINRSLDPPQEESTGSKNHEGQNSSIGVASLRRRPREIGEWQQKKGHSEHSASPPKEERICFYVFVSFKSHKSPCQKDVLGFILFIL